MFRIQVDSSSRKNVKCFVFNDGSVQIQLPDDLPPLAAEVIISAHMKTPGDQMALVMITNAVREVYPSVDILLEMPFTPYGRQDAVFVSGQANAMKAWAGIINSLGFREVWVTDPHSIAVSHIDNLQIEDICEVLQGAQFVEKSGLDFNELVLVSPDAGANKKAHKLCQTFGIKNLVRADKARDLETGEIIETELFGDVSGKVCLIVDDICDGGMTFIKLGEKLKEHGASKVVLFVTHGLFTKGLSVFDGIIDEIYTTTSWDQEKALDYGTFDKDTFKVL